MGFSYGTGRAAIPPYLDIWDRDVPRRPDRNDGMLVGWPYPDTWDGTSSQCPTGRPARSESFIGNHPQLYIWCKNHKSMPFLHLCTTMTDIQRVLVVHLNEVILPWGRQGTDVAPRWALDLRCPLTKLDKLWMDDESLIQSWDGGLMGHKHEVFRCFDVCFQNLIAYRSAQILWYEEKNLKVRG